MTLGERIAELRREAGLSQEALAEQMGVSRQAVSKWEKGQSYPDTENLLLLADIFHVSADSLAGIRLNQQAEPAEEPPAYEPESAPKPQERKRRAPAVLIIVMVLLVALMVTCGPVIALVLFNTIRHDPAISDSVGDPAAGQPSIVEVGPKRPDFSETGEFALLWQGEEDWEYLRAGNQEEGFPFGTTLAPTQMETVTDTDYRVLKLHEVVCGALTLRYTVNSEDNSSSLIQADVITPGYMTPRDIAVGSAEAEVLSQYGDALVYLLQEEGQVLCRHEYAYAYSPEDAFGTALIFYIDRGQVAGLRLRAGDDMGNEAFKVNYTSIFPVVNGEPDFSQRENREQRDLEATQAAYVALYALDNDRNLSAEEAYQHRQTIYEALPVLDWGAFAGLGEAGKDTETISSLLSYLEEQAGLSVRELECLQRGCFQVDGWYAEWYSVLLAKAFIAHPEEYVRAISGWGEEDADHLIGATAFGCEFPEELYAQARTAIEYLTARSGALYTQEEKDCGQKLYDKIMGTKS